MVLFFDTYSSDGFQSLLSNVFDKPNADELVRMSGRENCGCEETNLPVLPFVQNETAQIGSVANVQTVSAQIPSVLNLVSFSHHLEIINKCRSDEERLFYILYSFREKLKLAELKQSIAHQTFETIASSDKTRYSLGMQNAYPQALSILKDQAIVDFLNLPARHNEKQLHQGILQNMKQFILELGKDFLFVDSEYPLHVGSSTYKVDLLFFHRALQCLVAVELKAKPFKPEYIGQLEFYLEALDRDVKRSNENPSIRILLCQSADRSVVEYAMSRSMSPTMVAEYKRKLIPKETLQQSFDDFVRFITQIK